MVNSEILDDLIGTRVPFDKILLLLTEFEFSELSRLTRKFGFEENGVEYRETVLALYRFKRTLGHYVSLWQEAGRPKVAHPLTEREMGVIFGPVAKFLGKNDKECFTHNQFFGKAHYLLHACEVHSVPPQKRKAYLKLLYGFPVVPSTTFKEVVENPIWPANLPHTFMHMAAGLIRAELVRERDHKNILATFRKFLRERHIGKAHARWFKTRFAGSYGSRQ